MAKIRKIYDQTIKPDGSKTTIYPITSTRAVYTPDGVTLDSYLKDGYFHGADLAGYKVVYDVSQLPTGETHFGYLIDDDLYVWVGTNGNVLDGTYQNCGPFRGPKGDYPDEEDLTTNSQGLLTFKNRTSQDGLGYYILRENKSFAEQVIYDNTVYEIRYDFDLYNDDIILPEGCTFNFTGGKLSNGTLIGNGTAFNTDVTYQIFDNVEFSGFIIPYIDIRWFGAIPDFNESLQTGTDNTPYLEAAITLAGKYYAGTGIRIVGSYMLATGITTEYDVNIFGYHNNSRRLLVSPPDPSSPSLLFIGASNTAITMNGLGESAKSANISLHNLKIWGPTSATFINYTASGAPGRVSIIEECEFRGLNTCIKLINSSADTMLGNLTISKCNVWYSDHFLVANSTGNNRTLCNLIIENCNIEQGGSKQIEIENAFSSIIIRNNIIENLDAPIDITAISGKIKIEDNYFESITGDAIKVTSKNANTTFYCGNNFYDNFNLDSTLKVKFNLSLVEVFDLDFKYCASNSVFNSCTFNSTCIGWGVFNLNWINMYCLFDAYNFQRGMSLSPYKTASKTIGNLIAGACTTSYTNFISKTYGEMPQKADCFVFAVDGTELSVGLATTGGSANYNVVYGRNGGYFCVYRQLPYDTGESLLKIKGVTNCAVGPVQILDPDTDKLTDACVPSIYTVCSFASSNRPTFDKPKGYIGFDETLGRLVMWNGIEWVNTDGTAIS